MTALAYFISLRRRKGLPQEEIAGSELRGERKCDNLRGLIKNCTKPGAARQWTIICFSITGTIIVIIFLLLFVWLPTGKLLSKPSPLAFGSKVVENDKLATATNVSTWLGESSQAVIPRACHSHNDYSREIPLFSALSAGCIGIEADVWLSDDGKDLLVGHERNSLQSTKTLQSMYINPLLEILNDRNPTQGANSVYDRAQGIFSTRPNTTVILMVDVKEKPTSIWPLLVKQLEPLRQRQFLTRYEQVYSEPSELVGGQTLQPAPLIIVGSGELNLTSLVGAYPNGTFGKYHDTFLDAPLQNLPEANHFRGRNVGTSPALSRGQALYSAYNSHYASVSFKQSIGSVILGFGPSQLDNLRTQIRIARESGLVSRYWDIPSWPINYRDYIWDVLTQEGVGILNVDDVQTATHGLWTEGYLKSVYSIIATSAYLVIMSIIIWIIVLYILRENPDG
ncbi:hypothetical protein NUW58_g1336 [Xylaria curta]|uniref:Uncharacterized protein n=1 Tax=Xylaria curta TaxID=42375 RepID=A0ACC1PND8_9PEZI|nr:hypothetical protein NUW58_g1336 [Xylaria curta]